MLLNDKEVDQILLEMEAMCSRLMEMGCDAVQINASAHIKPNDWCRIDCGHGNFFARRGILEEFLNMNNCNVLANQIKNCEGD